MRIVKSTTKLGQRIIDTCKHPIGTELHHVYNKFSQAKARAYEWCRQRCYEQNGSGFAIVAKNCDNFSVCWWTSEGLHYETSHNSYLVRFE